MKRGRFGVKLPKDGDFWTRTVIGGHEDLDNVDKEEEIVQRRRAWENQLLVNLNT